MNFKIFLWSITLLCFVDGGRKVRMKSYYKFRTEYRPLGVVIDEDACAYLKVANSTKVINFSFFKNLPKEVIGLTCPFNGPIIFTLKDVEFNSLPLPAFAPVGEWYFDTIQYTIVNGKEVFLTKVQNFFEIRYTYSFN